MCIPKIGLISCVPKNLELIEIHCAISELEHADGNDRRRKRVRLGVQNLKRKTHTAVHTGAQNTHHSPYWRTEHTPQSRGPSQAANELEW